MTLTGLERKNSGFIHFGPRLNQVSRIKFLMDYKRSTGRIIIYDYKPLQKQQFGSTAIKLAHIIQLFLDKS